MATWKLAPDTGQIGGGPHSSMPLVVIPSEIEIGAITLAEAQSSRYYTDSGLVTEVAREVVSSDELHFDGSSVSSSSEYWMDFDGVRSDYAVTATYGRNAVWGGYLGVWHFNDQTNTTIRDSAGHYADGTKNSTNRPFETAGKIGKSQDFGTYYGIDDIKFNEKFIPSAQNFTLTQWMKPNNAMYTLAVSQDNGSGRNFFLALSNQRIGFTVWNTFNSRFNNFTPNDGSNPVPTDQWSYASVTYNQDAESGEIRVNGVHKLDLVFSGTLRTNSTYSKFSGWGDTTANNWGGEMDETRFYNGVLTNDWITTEYNNQNDNAAFWVATDVSGGGGGGGGWVGYPMIHMLQFNCVM